MQYDETIFGGKLTDWGKDNQQSLQDSHKP